MAKLSRLFYAVVVAGLLACSQEQGTQDTASAPSSDPATPTSGAAARVIEVQMSFIEPRFQPGPISAEVGKPIQFKLRSADTRHSFVIESLGIDVEVPQTSLGEDVTTKVVIPQKAGEYRIFCRFHSRMPMETTLVVSDAKP